MLLQSVNSKPKEKRKKLKQKTRKNFNYKKVGTKFNKITQKLNRFLHCRAVFSKV